MKGLVILHSIGVFTNFQIPLYLKNNVFEILCCSFHFPIMTLLNIILFDINFIKYDEILFTETDFQMYG